MTTKTPIVKLFVSGKFADKPLIKSKITELEQLGYEITHDWTQHEETLGNQSDAQVAALFDIEGVKKCDIHIVIISDETYPYRGTFCEMGCALGLDKKILVWNPFENPTCTKVPFYYHPHVSHFNTWDELLNNLAPIGHTKQNEFAKWVEDNERYCNKYNSMS